MRNANLHIPISISGLRRSFRAAVTATAAVAISMSSLVSIETAAAQPVTTCLGSECEVVFEYTGASVSWQVPANVNDLRFDLFGAQGGRSGGLGGRVTGKLTEWPSVLIINVGGAGSQGSHVNGGFNGGGRSGGNHSDEGSGGGASDIRTDSTLGSRLAVAGGGGGTGGWSGGAGGAGGGLQGQNGFSGQGGGGGGGSQTAGGAVGSSNGGTVGSSGTFGNGGTGGSSGASGGGGGGGGWYGGGGGGGDVDTCCLDGGGGGGGSSYTVASATDVQHFQGARNGHGLVVLRYSVPLTVTAFAAVQRNQDALFEISFSDAVTELDAEVFQVQPEQCRVAEIIASATDYVLVITDCPEGEVSVTLPENAIVGSVSGPPAAVSASMLLDLTPPNLAWQVAQYNLINSVEFWLEVAGATSFAQFEDFVVSGCDEFELDHRDDGILINAYECADGEVTLTVAPHSFADEHGNTSPEFALSANSQVDLHEPEAEWNLGEMSFEEGLASFEATATFSEPVAWADGFDGASTDADCLVASDFSELQLSLSFIGCAVGEFEVVLAEYSLVDLAGRLGPITESTLRVSVLAPVPAPVLAPVLDSAPTPLPGTVVVNPPGSVQQPVESPIEPGENVSAQPPISVETPVEAPIFIPPFEPDPKPAETKPERGAKQPATESAESLEQPEPESTESLEQPAVEYSQDQLTVLPQAELIAFTEPTVSTVQMPTSPEPPLPLGLAIAAAIGSVLAAGSLLLWHRRRQ